MKKYENYERILHFQNQQLSSLKKTNEYFTNKIESLELIISKILTSTITKGEMQTIIKNEIRVATSYSHRTKGPTTIGAKKLNCCVRHGNRCILLANITTLSVCCYLFFYWVNLSSLKTEYQTNHPKPSNCSRG